MRSITRKRSWPAAAVVAAALVATSSSSAAAAPIGDVVGSVSTTIGLTKNVGVKRPKVKHGELTIKGTRANEKIALRLQAGDPGILEVDVGDDGSADFTVRRDKIDRIAVDAKAGDDVVRIDEGNGVFTTDIQTRISGGDGDDTLLGGAGAESMHGGDGNDVLDGNGGNDVAQLGAADDLFVWDPGDGSDTIEGQAGTDTMRFNGAGVAENVDLSANGTRLRFFRTPGNVTMDTAGVERVDFNALGGADVVTVNDLTATSVDDVRVDLAGTLGGATGDGQTDRIVVNATDGDDTILVHGDSKVVKTSGLAATVSILTPEGSDRLEVNTLTGGDTVDATGLAADAIQLFVDGVLVP